MKHQDVSPGVYTIEEVRTILRCTRNTVYKHIKAGSFPAKKVDRHYRIPIKSFEAWLFE
jgi:excisionase family DNA binding protein